MNDVSSTENKLQAQARRRVGIKLGFYTHAGVYLLVNLGLFAIDSMNGGRSWSHFPLLGWGLGLAIHGVAAFLSLQGQGVRERLLSREIEQLRRRP